MISEQPRIQRLAARATAMVAMATLGACASPTETFALRCDVAISELTPQPAAVGEAVVATGTPFTSVYDSAVYVGDSRATILDVSRAECASCDACRDQQGCTECSDCDACDRICNDECVETVTFEVPPVGPGLHGMQLFNAHGQTEVLMLNVESTGYVGDTADTGTSSDTGNPLTVATSLAP